MEKALRNEPQAAASNTKLHLCESPRAKQASPSIEKKMTSFGTAGGVHVNMSIDPSRHLASGGFYLNYTHWTQV